MSEKIRIQINKNDLRVMIPERFEITFPVGIIAGDLYGVSIARRIYDVQDLCKIIANDPRLREDLYQIFVDICYDNLVRLIEDMAREAILSDSGC